MTFEDRNALEEKGGLQWLQRKFKLRPPQVTVLKQLVKFWQPEKDGCKPTQDTLSRHTGFPLRTVENAVYGLKEKGLIKGGPEPYRDRRGRKRPGKINSYHFANDVIDAITGVFKEIPDTHPLGGHIPTQQVGSTHSVGGNIPTQQVGEKQEVETGIKQEVEISPFKAGPNGPIRESGEGNLVPFRDRGQWIDELRAVNTGEREKTIRAAIRDHGGYINGESIPHTVDAGVAFLENAFDQIGLVL